MKPIKAASIPDREEPITTKEVQQLKNETKKIDTSDLWVYKKCLLENIILFQPFSFK